MKIKLTKDNVKIGDILFVKPTDTRHREWNFKVGSIGRKYIIDEYGYQKIEIGTYEIFRKDGIGSVEYVYLNEEEYHKESELNKKRVPFANKMYSSSYIYQQMSDEDIDAISNIMCKYDSEWATR